jgi:hypothetical protein
MKSIDIETLLTIIYVVVDDWYKAVGGAMKKGQRGAKAVFSDSEMLTLMVAHDYIPYPGETQYVSYIRAKPWEPVSTVGRPKPVQPRVTRSSRYGGGIATGVGGSTWRLHL